MQDDRLETPALGADFALVVSGVSCYANGDGNTTTPNLTGDDFACFVARFAQGCPTR